MKTLPNPALGPTRKLKEQLVFDQRRAMIQVRQFRDWPKDDIGTLLVESERQGFRFLARLAEEWKNGSNRFSQPGEALFGVFEGNQLLAIGGINRQSKTIGRLRRFFVRSDARRKGTGTMLCRHILEFASKYYEVIVLRTDTEEAESFYNNIGFVKTDRYGDATHSISLEKKCPTGR